MIFALGICLLFSLSANSQKPGNERPIIGVLTEEVNSTIVSNAKSHIVASYVKFLESGGARVVPIWDSQPRKYYEDIMSKINGVLFPGAGVESNSKGYGETGSIIFDIATKMNDKGEYFPLWGTCLGFELLSYLVANKRLFTTCNADDLPTNIEFSKDYKNGRMWQDLEGQLEKKMQKQKVAIHYHHWCLTPKNFTISGLDKYYRVLALNQDSKNTTFISIIEAIKYPFYGVAFHPEKVLFEWEISDTQHHIPHNIDAIRASQYFANFFVNEARKSSHRFPNKTSEDAVLVYNYNTVFTGQFGTNPNTQTYYFMQ